MDSYETGDTIADRVLQKLKAAISIKQDRCEISDKEGNGTVKRLDQSNVFKIDYMFNPVHMMKLGVPVWDCSSSLLKLAESSLQVTHRNMDGRKVTFTCVSEDVA